VQRAHVRGDEAVSIILDEQRISVRTYPPSTERARVPNRLG
jgi:hypothetical protein